VGLDNFSAGLERNVEAAKAGMAKGARFSMLHGDIRDMDACMRACDGVRFVLHHAALVSVPGSVADPAAAHANNVDGFFNMLKAAKENGVRRFVYASSSAVYGDCKKMPLREEYADTAEALSPYAATKKINELYAAAWGNIYGLESVGLRYFNVFGPRQDPNGPYAAVIPRWLHALSNGLPATIYGDGENTRDFCYIKDVVEANILAATSENREAVGKVCNIAGGVKTTLNELYRILKRKAAPALTYAPLYEDFRAGDIMHSSASIERARLLLGYSPSYSLENGLDEMIKLKTDPASK
jgi:UDP-N-acetylglucosamine 4-epimerase